MNEEKFKWLDETNTIGKLKKKIDYKDFIKKHKRIGALSVWLLKDFIEHIKDPHDNKQIGIYIATKGKHKGYLLPIHCNGYMLAPIVPNNKIQLEEGLSKEGRK